MSARARLLSDSLSRDWLRRKTKKLPEEIEAKAAELAAEDANTLNANINKHVEERVEALLRKKEAEYLREIQEREAKVAEQEVELEGRREEQRQQEELLEAQQRDIEQLQEKVANGYQDGVRNRTKIKPLDNDELLQAVVEDAAAKTLGVKPKMENGVEGKAALVPSSSTLAPIDDADPGQDGILRMNLQKIYQEVSPLFGIRLFGVGLGRWLGFTASIICVIGFFYKVWHGKYLS